MGARGVCTSLVLTNERRKIPKRQCDSESVQTWYMVHQHGTQGGQRSAKNAQAPSSAVQQAYSEVAPLELDHQVLGYITITHKAYHPLPLGSRGGDGGAWFSREARASRRRVCSRLCVSRIKILSLHFSERQRQKSLAASTSEPSSKRNYNVSWSHGGY